jgi:PAS domain S-box-containing protein
MSGRAREAAWLLLVAAAYFAAGTLGLRLAFVHESASAVWPPTGIAMAAVLLRGPRVWPAILAAAFFVNQTAAGSAPSSLLIAAGNTLEALVGGSLARRWAGGTRAFESIRGTLRFTLGAGLGAPALSATVGVLALAGLGYAAWARVPLIWLTWWLGDAAGALLVTPVIVLWALQPRWERGPARLLEFTALLLVLTVCAAVVFGPLLPAEATGSPIAFVCLPPLLWAALRFGPREMATATLLTSALAVAGTVSGLGPYGREGPVVALLLVQGYAVVTVVMALALSAAVAERERQHRTTHERDAQALSEAQALAHIGSWSWDIPSDVVTWSDEMFRIYGLAPQSLRISYDTFLSSLHPLDRPRVEETVRHSFTSGQPFAMDHRIVRPDGVVRWLHGRGSVQLGEKGPVRMVGTGQDITERRRAEEAARAFLANAAHELRTPLTSVMGLADLIAAVGRSVNSPLLDEYCEMLRRQGVRARRLISGLLDVSRMEQGLLEVRLERVALLDAVRRAADAVPRAAGQTLEVDVPESLCVEADALGMDEVLVNLLHNAFAHGGPHAGVTARDRDHDVRLEVWDDGEGVADELRPHLFEPFARGRAAREVEGAGLGLAIVRGLVQAVGGRVWHEARQPRGARFIVSLRRAPAGGAAAAYPARLA